MRIHLWLATMVFFSTSLFARASGQPHVVFVTLDGVRWQDIFSADPKMPYLTRELPKSGFLFGDPARGESMVVSNPVNISLPGYQAIMAGYAQDCLTNDCPRVPVETMQERIKRELQLNQLSVATFASWKQIALAAEHVEGSTFVNAGLVPVEDGTLDPGLFELNQRQAGDPPPWHDARYDRDTFAQALRYLKKHEPRFLYISLNDSDEWAHRSDWERYQQTLLRHDARIRELVEVLQSMDAYANDTTLIVTTDHGRGNGVHWHAHGSHLPESKQVWMFGMTMRKNRRKMPLNLGFLTHSDLRPTMEAALNLKPLSCEKCGHVIDQVLQ